MRVVAGLCFLVLVPGCAHKVDPPSPGPASPVVELPPPQAVSSAPAEAAPPSVPRGPCDAVMAANRRVTEPVAEVVASEATRGRVAFAKAIATCVPAGRGAWAVSVLAAGPSPGGERGVSGTWALTYVAPDGQVTRACDVAPARPVAGLCGSYSLGDRGFEIPPSLLASDLDGDGVAEAVATVDSCWDEGAGCWSTITVVTWQGGKMAPYAPASSFKAAGVEDADHDGLVDLVVHAPWVASSSDCLGNEHAIVGPRLLAHARPGGSFMLTDDVAARFARASCEKVPDAIVVEVVRSSPSPAPDEVDYEATGRAVACARMRGATPAQMLAKLRGVCARFAPVEACTSAPLPPKTCPDWLERWARAEPTVSIGKR